MSILLLIHLGGPSAKVGSSANYCVLVFKASLLYYPGGSICQSMFVCQVFVYWYSRHLFLDFTGGSIGHSRFICQFWCTCIQGISALYTQGSICQSMFVCQVLCTGNQGISALLMGVSICQSMFVCQVLCTGIQGIYFLIYRGVHWPK